jgi:hypothetical protein
MHVRHCSPEEKLKYKKMAEMCKFSNVLAPDTDYSFRLVCRRGNEMKAGKPSTIVHTSKTMRQAKRRQLAAPPAVSEDKTATAPHSVKLLFSEYKVTAPVDVLRVQYVRGDNAAAFDHKKSKATVLNHDVPAHKLVKLTSYVIEGLKANTKYSFRLVAVNAGSIVAGPSQSFMTAPMVPGLPYEDKKRRATFDTVHMRYVEEPVCALAIPRRFTLRHQLRQTHICVSRFGCKRSIHDSPFCIFTVISISITGGLPTVLCCKVCFSSARRCLSFRPISPPPRPGVTKPSSVALPARKRTSKRSAIWKPTRVTCFVSLLARAGSRCRDRRRSPYTHCLHPTA